MADSNFVSTELHQPGEFAFLSRSWRRDYLFLVWGSFVTAPWAFASPIYACVPTHR